MEECVFCDLVDMREESEGGVKDDAKVTDVSGGVDNGAIDGKRKILG